MKEQQRKQILFHLIRIFESLYPVRTKDRRKIAFSAHCVESVKRGIKMLPRKVHLPKIKNPPPKIDPLVAKRRKILELQGQG